MLAMIHGLYLKVTCLAQEVSIVSDISHLLGGRKEASLYHLPNLR